MKMTVSELCALVEGDLVGDGEAVVEGVASLATAGPGDVTFAKRERLKEVASTKATAVLVPEKVSGATAAQIVVENPYFTFGMILHAIQQEQCDHPKGIHATAVIGEGTKLGKDVALGAYAVIGDHCVIGDRTVIYPNTTIGSHVVIGEDCVIHSNVAIRELVTIGNRTVIHSCCTIGGDGFGFLPDQGGHVKIPQIGVVEIGDDVEIGCNCTVDRATMEATRIGNGVKIDNHSHLAHNVQVGENSILIAYARIGGSTVIGKNCILTEDVGVTNGVTLGDGCIIGACSKVSRSWPANSVLLGAPAQKGEKEKVQIALMRRLPRIYESLRELQKKVEELEKKGG